MTPQFVDFNADGHIDMLAGTFGGVVQVAFGDGAHFAQPKTLVDASGDAIMMNAFWNRDEKKWDETHRCDPDGYEGKAHLTSAWATDWDGDGDLDLLLGDHDHKGRILLRRNEGSEKEAQFATKNEFLDLGGKPLNAVGAVWTLCMRDWNGDGLEDLIVTTKDLPKHGEKATEAVHVYLNEGSPKAPKLAAPTSIFSVQLGELGSAPTGPATGLYSYLVDFDADGDLDLAVGGASHWQPEGRTLTAEEVQVVADLRAQLESMDKEMSDFFNSLTEQAGDTSTDEGMERYKQIWKEHEGAYSKLVTKRTKLQERLDALVPSPKRRTSVWLYENLGAAASRPVEAGASKGK